MPHGMWDLSFPHQGLNWSSLQWNHRVLTIGLPRKSLQYVILNDTFVQVWRRGGDICEPITNVPFGSLYLGWIVPYILGSNTLAFKIYNKTLQRTTPHCFMFTTSVTFSVFIYSWGSVRREIFILWWFPMRTEWFPVKMTSVLHVFVPVSVSKPMLAVVYRPCAGRCGNVTIPDPAIVLWVLSVSRGRSAHTRERSHRLWRRIVEPHHLLALWPWASWLTSLCASTVPSIEWMSWWYVPYTVLRFK